MSDARDAILRAIRTAPRGEALPHDVRAQAEIARGLESITPQTGEGLIEQFRHELEQLDASFARASSPPAAAADVGAFLKASGCNRVGVAAPPLDGLTSILEAAGIEVRRLADLDPGSRRSWLASADATVTGADFGLADTGTLVLGDTTLPDRLVAARPRCHVAVLRRDRLLPHMWALLERRGTLEGNSLFFVTGPSRTADIEKQVVVGAHGPARLRVVLVD